MLQAVHRSTLARPSKSLSLKMEGAFRGGQFVPQRELLDQVRMWRRGYKDAERGDGECVSEEHRQVLVAAGRKMKRFMERLCKGFWGRSPDTANILYSYHLLSVYMSQQAHQGAF